MAEKEKQPSTDKPPAVTGSPPIVIPVRPEETEKPPKEVHPNLMQLPSVTMLCSPIRTGKSTLISNLLLNEDFYGQHFFDKVVIFSNTIMNDTTSRFLCKRFECHTEYSDDKLQQLINEQLSYAKEDRPDLALIFDDILGSIGKNSLINSFATRFRHYNVKLLLFSVQNFKGIMPIIRNNVTDLIVGSPFGNRKQLEQIAEDFGDNFENDTKFLQLYKEATQGKRYHMMYCKLAENPAQVFRNFETQIYPSGGGAQKNTDD
eukprot:SAG22_NODE_509_length_9598_cov_12.010001_8_plen_261_part_00